VSLLHESTELSVEQRNLRGSLVLEYRPDAMHISAEAIDALIDCLFISQLPMGNNVFSKESLSTAEMLSQIRIERGSVDGLIALRELDSLIGREANEPVTHAIVTNFLDGHPNSCRRVQDLNRNVGGFRRPQTGRTFTKSLAHQEGHRSLFDRPRQVLITCERLGEFLARVNLVAST
jgi:hypothetical protein